MNPRSASARELEWRDRSRSPGSPGLVATDLPIASHKLSRVLRTGVRSTATGRRVRNPADGAASRGDGAQGRCTGTGTDGRRRVVRAAPRAHSDIVDAHRWLWVRVVNRARAPAGQTLRWAAKCPAGHPNVPEIRGVTDIEQDSCCGPDPDVWHHGCAIHRSDIMFIIGHFRSSLESPDRGRGARRDRPGTTDAGTRLTRRPAPGCGTATRFTALSWLCGRAGEPSVQFSTATDRPDRTGRGWAG